MTLETNSSSSAETEQLGKVLGSRLKGGEVIELVSDLGGGKTTFTRGLAEGIGSKDHVSSPTFKVCNVYEGLSLKLYHYDFYRLVEAGLIEHELADAFDDDDAVIIVEWSDVVKHVLPDNRLTIELKNLDNDNRKIVYKYSENLGYLFE